MGKRKKKKKKEKEKEKKRKEWKEILLRAVVVCNNGDDSNICFKKNPFKKVRRMKRVRRYEYVRHKYC